MQADEIKKFLENKLPDADIYVSGQDCELQLIIVHEKFSGMSPVKRQQLVYKHLMPLITQAKLHAVSMKTFTLDEYSSNQ